MHDLTVKLKSGEKLIGPLWKVDIQEGWFTIVSEDDHGEIRFDDCESVTTDDYRHRVDQIVDNFDMLAKWRDRQEREKPKPMRNPE
jgi:hypothetical protein